MASKPKKSLSYCHSQTEANGTWNWYHGIPNGLLELKKLTRLRKEGNLNKLCTSINISVSILVHDLTRVLITGNGNILKPGTHGPSCRVSSLQPTRPQVNWLFLSSVLCLRTSLSGTDPATLPGCLPWTWQDYSCHRALHWPFLWPIPSGSSHILFISLWSFGNTTLLERPFLQFITIKIYFFHDPQYFLKLFICKLSIQPPKS